MFHHLKFIKYNDFLTETFSLFTFFRIVVNLAPDSNLCKRKESVPMLSNEMPSRNLMFASVIDSYYVPWYK